MASSIGLPIRRVARARMAARLRVGPATLAGLALAWCGAPADGQTWQRVGPLTADVCSVAADPSRPQTLYAGLTGGGLFRSTDGGARWSLRSAWPSRICSLAVGATDPDLLVAIVEASPGSTDSSLAVSEDGGATWQVRSPAGAARFDLASLALASGAAEEIYLAARPQGGESLRLWRSTDRGRSWQSIDGALPRASLGGTVAVDPAGPGRVVAALEAGIYRSTDSGRTWAHLAASPLAPGYATSLWFDPARTGVLFALGPYYHGFARSPDGGSTWTQLPLPDNEIPTSVSGDAGSGDLFLATFPRSERWSHVQRSTDDGLTWRQMATPGLTKEIGLFTTASGLIGFAGGGIARSVDRGESWSWSNSGLRAGSVATLAQGPTGDLFAVYDHFQAFGRGSDGAWRLLATPTDWILHAAIGPRGALLYDTGISSVAIVRSLDGGVTWDAGPALECWSGTRSLLAPASALYLTADLTCEVDGDRFCVLMRSDDLGDTWSCLARGRVAYDIVGTDRTGKVVYATDGTRLLRSTDRGMHFPVRGPLPTGAQRCAGLVVHPDRPDVLVCNAPGTLLWTRDGGKTWSRFANNPGIVGKRFVLRGAASGSVQLLGVVSRGDRDALVYTGNSGRKWTELAVPWRGTFLRRPFFDPTDPKAFLFATRGAGVLRARLAPP